MKKILLIVVALAFSLATYAQETITLVVSGEGTTKEKATANALRSAIEQSFGTFVSANTQILNDEIVKDEIATIASGNIKEYKELGCVTLPSGDQSVSLAATVSLSNLISYSKSKGSSAEFAGAAFAMNIRMRKLNAENEITALYDMLEQLYVLAPSVFDWDLEVGEPSVLSENMYQIPMIAKAKINSNTSSFFSILFNTLESLSLSPSEVEGYKANKMEVYNLTINDREFVLRNDYRAFTTYVEYLINCIGESFHIYGQFGDKKTKLLYDLKYMSLVRRKSEYSHHKTSHIYLYTYKINNLNMLMGGTPGTIAFQRDLSVTLEENTLYQVYGFEVVPAPNISRISFVCKDGKMVVDTMNVYQSVGFNPEGDFDEECRKAFKHMRVLYVSEDCPARVDELHFNNHDSLQTIIVERLYRKQNHSGHPYPIFYGCDNLQMVRIGKIVKYGVLFESNPKLSTVILGSTLTYDDEVIDLTSLTEKDLQNLQGIIIFGDEVESMPNFTDFGNRRKPTKSLSVVFNSKIKDRNGINFYPAAKFAIWLNASKPDEFSTTTIDDCDLILVPKECLSYFQNRYYNKDKFLPLEDKMSELGCANLLSLLKKLNQETINVK